MIKKSVGTLSTQKICVKMCRLYELHVFNNNNNFLNYTTTIKNKTK